MERPRSDRAGNAVPARRHCGSPHVRHKMEASIDDMPDPAARKSTNPSAGGARAAGGLAFQAEVFAWWAAHAVSDTAPGLGLDPAVRIDAVGCETGFPVDDVGLALTGGGFILAQAKRGMRRLDPRAADLQSALDQLVHAMIDGLNVNDVAMRPADETRDRLVIVTSHDGSRSFDVLGRVCDRLRGQPPSAAVRTAAVNEEERTALETLLTIIHTAWTADAGREPTEEELRGFRGDARDGDVPVDHQVQEPCGWICLPQDVPVGALERGTGHDQAAVVADTAGYGLEPGLPVLVGQRESLAHLGDVAARVE